MGSSFRHEQQKAQKVRSRTQKFWHFSDKKAKALYFVNVAHAVSIAFPILHLIRMRNNVDSWIHN